MNFMRFILLIDEGQVFSTGMQTMWKKTQPQETSKFCSTSDFFAQTPDVWVCLRTAGENRKGLVTGAGQRAEHFYEY